MLHAPTKCPQSQVGKTGGKKYLLRLTQRWENITQIDYKEVRCEGVDWIYLAQEMEGYSEHDCTKRMW